MNIAQGIRTRGFRKWYERELLSGHAHLVLLLLCTLALLGALEAASVNRGQRPLMLLCIAVAGAVGVWALRRYLFLLARAEHIANQANCPQCREYARWTIDPAPTQGDGSTLRVCCKTCQQRWRIDW